MFPDIIPQKLLAAIVQDIRAFQGPGKSLRKLFAFCAVVQFIDRTALRQIDPAAVIPDQFTAKSFNNLFVAVDQKYVPGRETVEKPADLVFIPVGRYISPSGSIMAG